MSLRVNMNGNRKKATYGKKASIATAAVAASYASRNIAVNAAAERAALDTITDNNSKTRRQTCLEDEISIALSRSFKKISLQTERPSAKANHLQHTDESKTENSKPSGRSELTDGKKVKDRAVKSRSPRKQTRSGHTATEKESVEDVTGAFSALNLDKSATVQSTTDNISSPARERRARRQQENDAVKEVNSNRAKEEPESIARSTDERTRTPLNKRGRFRTERNGDKATEDDLSVLLDKQIHLESAQQELSANQQTSKQRSKLNSQMLDITPRRRRSETESICAAVELLDLRPIEQIPDWLLPLEEAYYYDRQVPLEVKSWEDVLADGAQIEKIAEASYAEVYRISNAAGSSILKMMCLKPPKGPGSHRETAISISDAVPEMQILDQLTVIHGFVEFKDAHLVRGTPPKAVVEAYKTHRQRQESAFPLPSSYAKGTYWLVFELGDAGQVLEDFPIKTVEEAWDILLGVIIALYHGEIFCSFEHRDLHENNICIRKIRRSTPPSGRKLGFTNLCVTLLDYTLSRAESEEGVVRALDLEQDLSLFSNLGHRGKMDEIQYEVYRRMRMLLLTGRNKKSRPEFHEEYLPDNPWLAHLPGTNLLWIDYLFEFVIRQCKDTKVALKVFKAETNELRKLLRLNDRNYQSVSDIMEYCLGKGWVTEEDIANYGVPNDE